MINFYYKNCDFRVLFLILKIYLTGLLLQNTPGEVFFSKKATS